MHSIIMSVQINLFKNKKKNNIIIFFNKSISYSKFEKIIGRKIVRNLTDFINKKKYSSQIKKIFHIHIDTFEKIIFVDTSIVNKENAFLEYEKIGANLYDYLKKNYIDSVKFLDENVEIILNYNQYFLNQILYGFNLKSYKFTKYLTQNKDVKINFYFSKKLKNFILKKIKNLNRFWKV
jgi:leucyl aminopeptidase